MDTLITLPEWLGAAIAGAVLAACGYIAKLIIEWAAKVNDKRRSRRAHLIELHSKLKAGKVAVGVQYRHRDDLLDLINKRDPDLSALSEKLGYNHVFAMAYPNMTAEEKELHQIIRAITEHTILPQNQSLLEWLRKDDYFKTKTWGRGLKTDLANSLSDLEVHLILWMAKYKIWLPDRPENSLVYLADEMAHGVGFPSELQKHVENVLKKWWLFGA